jgi:hypothetical protein
MAAQDFVHVQAMPERVASPHVVRSDGRVRMAVHGGPPLLRDGLRPPMPAPNVEVATVDVGTTLRVPSIDLPCSAQQRPKRSTAMTKIAQDVSTSRRTHILRVLGVQVKEIA